MKEQIIAFVLVSLFSIIIFMFFWHATPYHISVDENIRISDTVSVVKTEPWKVISYDIAHSHEYDYLKYNCWDYSTDLKNALVRAGYKARIITGMYKGYAHAWVELNGMWIESTSGSVITGRTNYQFGYYSMDKHNYYKVLA